jgi:hypothetical protein
MGEFAAETKAVAVEVLGGTGVGHVKERDGERQQSAPHGEGMRQILQPWRTREEAAGWAGKFWA